MLHFRGRWCRFFSRYFRPRRFGERRTGNCICSRSCSLDFWFADYCHAARAGSTVSSVLSISSVRHQLRSVASPYLLHGYKRQVMPGKDDDVVVLDDHHMGFGCSSSHANVQLHWQIWWCKFVPSFNFQSWPKRKSWESGSTTIFRSEQQLTEPCHEMLPSFWLRWCYGSHPRIMLLMVLSSLPVDNGYNHHLIKRRQE